MRRLVFLLAAVLAASGLAQAPQPRAEADACKFDVSESTTKAVITGPDEIVKIVQVAEQPDSPAEILSVDFAGTLLSVREDVIPGHAQYTWRPKCVVKVRNRSNRFVSRVGISFLGSLMGAGGAGRLVSLAPGGEAEFRACGFGGNGTVPIRPPRILLAVDWTEFETCDYHPSIRIPHGLGIHEKPWLHWRDHRPRPH